MTASISRPAASDDEARVIHHSKLTASSSIQDRHQLKPVELNIVLWYIYILKLYLAIPRAKRFRSSTPSSYSATHRFLPLKWGWAIKDRYCQVSPFQETKRKNALLFLFFLLVLLLVVVVVVVLVVVIVVVFSIISIIIAPAACRNANDHPLLHWMCLNCPDSMTQFQYFNWDVCRISVLSIK